MMTTPFLDTPRLRLEPIGSAHLADVYQLFRQADVARLFGQDRMEDEGQARYWLEIQAQTTALGVGVCWGLRLKENGALIGTLCADGINLQWHNLALSYALLPTYWRRGLMREALSALIVLAWGGGFGVPMHRLQALVLPENLASIGLLRSLGFRLEGQRLGLIFWQQRYWDLESYCLLNPLTPAASLSSATAD